MENQQPSEYPEQNNQQVQPSELEYQQPPEESVITPPLDTASEHALDGEQPSTTENVSLAEISDTQHPTGDVPDQMERVPTPERPQVTDDHWAEFVAQHPQEEPRRSPDEIMQLLRDGSSQDKIFTAKETEDFIRRSLDGPLVLDVMDETYERRNSTDGVEEGKALAIEQWGEGAVEALGEDFFNKEFIANRDVISEMFIQDALKYSESGISPKIALMLVDTGLDHVVDSYIDKFSGLDANLASTLADKGKGWLVLDNASSFNGLEPSKISEIFVRELDSGKLDFEWLDDLLNKKLQEFKGLSNEVAEALVESQGVWWINYLSTEQIDETFPSFDHQKMAEYVAEELGSYEGEMVLDLFGKLRGVNSKYVQDKFIEHQAGYALFTHHSSFPDINLHEVLDLMIDTHDSEGISMVIQEHALGDIGSVDFAERLVDKKMLGVLAENLAEFDELHTEIAYDLLHAGYVDKIAANIDKFPDLSQAMLRRIIKYTKSEPKK